MKRVIRLTVAACFLMLMTVPLGVFAGEITYQISAGKYEITQDDLGFHRITMLTPGYGSIQSPGDPLLPEKMLTFRVPLDVIASSVKLTVEIQESVEIPGINIAPNPPMGQVVNDIELPYDPEYEDWGPEKSIMDGKNMYVYGRDADYPEKPAEFLGLTEKKEPMAGPIPSITQSVILPGPPYEIVAYVVVAYRPFLYNPVTKKLTLTKNAVISINYETPAPKTESQGASDSSTYDYVIITTDDIVANSDKLDNFVYLKELQGHTVRVVTDSDFGGLTGQPPNGTAEKIRQWLTNNYLPLGIDYVLLIGNPDPDNPADPVDPIGDIPMKMCLVNPLTFKLVPTDYFYADLSGNWDLDGDQYFGENLAVNHPESPDPSIGPDTFSARWTGKVMCDFAEDYEFRTFSDDGVRLWIDGVLVIDNWTGHPPTYDDSAPIPMTAGKHDVVLDFREDFGHGVIRLFWRTTGSDNVKRKIIPQTHLYDASDTVGGLTGTYYDNDNFTGTTFSRKDNVIDFIWGTGDKGTGGVDSGADVFVGRIPVYNNNYSDLDAILEKIVKYETDSGDISWRESILLPMVPLWDDTPSYHLGEGIKDDIAIPSSFDYYRIYDEDYSTSGGPTPELWPCTYNNVVGEWQNRYGMVVWATHGSSTGASHIITSGDVPALDDAKPSFTFQASCSNGHPETSNNLGYALLKHGAVATVSSSRVSWEYHGAWSFDPHNEANHNIGYYYTKKVIDDGIPKSAGAALYLTKGDIPAVGSNAMDYNLYGDPDCYLLTTVLNSPPVADANGPYTAECEGATTIILLDGTGSSDPNPGDILTYSWTTDCPGASFDDPNSPTPTLSVDSSIGCFDCTVSLTVTDFAEASDSSLTQVTIDDTKAPVITCPADVTIECDESTDPSNTDTATASDDCDASPTIDYSDFETSGTCPQEKTIIRTWTASDACGNTSSCVQTIKVVDTTPPEVNMSVGKDSLWPPNHKMVDVGLSYTVSDNCDPEPTVSIQVTSDEPTATALGAGGPQHSPDAEITDDGEVLLRAERSGKGDGRVYAITVIGTDACGNIASATSLVKVNHNNQEAVDSGQNYDATEIN